MVTSVMINFSTYSCVHNEGGRRGRNMKDTLSSPYMVLWHCILAFIMAYNIIEYKETVLAVMYQMDL